MKLCTSGLLFPDWFLRWYFLIDESSLHSSGTFIWMLGIVLGVESDSSPSITFSSLRENLIFGMWTIVESGTRICSSSPSSSSSMYPKPRCHFLFNRLSPIRSVLSYSHGFRSNSACATDRDRKFFPATFISLRFFVDWWISVCPIKGKWNSLVDYTLLTLSFLF